MALSDFTPDTEEIVISGRKGNTTITVRGLSFNDISKIIRVHYSDLDQLFGLYETHAGQDLTAIAAGRFAVTLISDAPGLVAHIIAIAADGEAALETAAKLPIVAQIEAIKSIAALTFSDVEDIKKLIAQVRSQFEKLTAENGS